MFRELYSEKMVVAEERRARIDNAPLGLFAQAFCKAAFANAYSHPVIGEPLGFGSIFLRPHCGQVQHAPLCWWRHLTRQIGLAKEVGFVM